MTSRRAVPLPIVLHPAGIRRARYALISAAIGLAAVPAVSAEPLPQERCEALAAELSLLEGGGAGENILKGPEWAKANLKPEQITYVRRLITVRELLLFRCRSYEVVRDPPPPSIAPAAAPVPGRKPQPPKAVAKPSPGADGVPPPVRPERQQAKADGTGESAAADKSKADAKPKLRGTLPAGKKAGNDVPPPARKAKPAAPAADRGN